MAVARCIPTRAASSLRRCGRSLSAIASSRSSALSTADVADPGTGTSWSSLARVATFVTSVTQHETPRKRWAQRATRRVDGHRRLPRRDDLRRDRRRAGAGTVARGRRPTGSTRVVATDDARPVPDGAEVVDLAGRFVIPGLIDSHQHLATPPDRVQAEAWLRRMVYGGVTAIRDMADDLRQIADLARACLVGEIPGPDIRYAALMAGPSFFDDPRTWQVSPGETPGTVPWMQAITDETDLVIATALARGTHASAIKIYADLPAELVAADRRRGAPAGGGRLGAPVGLPGAAARRRPLRRRRRLARLDAGLADPGRTNAPTYKSKAPIDPATIDPDDPRITQVLARHARARHDPRRDREHVGERRGPGRRATRRRSPGRRATRSSRRL